MVFKIIVIIALIIHFVLVFLNRKIYRTNIYLTLLISFLIIAIIGLLFRNNSILIFGHIYAVSFLLLPLISLLTIGFSRIFFEEIYDEPPLLTSPVSFVWDKNDKRKQHWGDAVFTVFVNGIPIILVLMLNNLIFDK